MGDNIMTSQHLGLTMLEVTNADRMKNMIK